MSILSNSNAISADGKYNITQSLRFRGNASAYLNRTPASAGNLKTWTWSGWVKRGELLTTQTLLAVGSATADRSTLYFTNGDGFGFFVATSGPTYRGVYTSADFRDVSAWYHFVCSVDTTQATDADRVKLYVNGELQSVNTFAGGYNTLNQDTHINSTSSHDIGRQGYSTSNYFDGYMAEVNFVDGQALTANDFGEYDSTTGVWKPKEYTGTYGTNGFYLNFSDGTSTTTLGYDQSSNSNDWTTNNISLTADTTYDLMADVPFPVDEDTANFCTLTPLSKADLDLPYANFLQGNLRVNYTNAAFINNNVYGTIEIPKSGKWYFEAILSNYYGSSSLRCGFNAGAAYLTVSATGNYAIAVDWDNELFWTRTNGTWTGDPEAGTGGTSCATSATSIQPYVRDNSGSTGNGGQWIVNFGQQPFLYTQPTGFKKVNTYNLPDSAIPNGSEYFKTVLYTGNGTSQDITSVGFTPDLVWHKGRSVAYSHGVVDSIRGDSNVMFTNATSAEQNPGDQLDIITDGFTTTYRSANLANNQSGATYVAWNWKGSDSSPVTNTDGTITSTVSANTTSGFSVVTYTGNNTTGATVGHGLGVVPKMIIYKRRDAAGYNWYVYHASIGNANALYLNTTDSQFSTILFNSTTPSSTVFTLYGAGSDINNGDILAYCFAEVEGFSSFSSYTGNGDLDGTFIYTGFRPAFVMIKRTDTTNGWAMLDVARSPYNDVDDFLYANLLDTEYANTSSDIDYLSNGFKLRSVGNAVNASGGTYIYMAFAENPFKNSLAR
jgi:hypothetical protein